MAMGTCERGGWPCYKLCGSACNMGVRFRCSTTPTALTTGCTVNDFKEIPTLSCGEESDVPQAYFTSQRFQIHNTVLSHRLECSIFLFYPAFLHIIIGEQSCNRIDRPGRYRACLCWVCLVVDRLFGARHKNICGNTTKGNTQ